jgi:Zn-dependent protease
LRTSVVLASESAPVKITRRLNLKRLTRVARVKGVEVYFHWSVFLIGSLILLGAFRQPLVALVGLVAYLSVLLIHEAGHLIVAHRMGYDALSIEIFPIYALARFEMPRTRFDTSIIAWGGVLAQAVIGVPLVASVIAFGYTPFDAVNALLAILGGVSLCIAALNLLPIAPLDGATAWDLIPAFIERRRTRPSRRAIPYKSSR